MTVVRRYVEQLRQAGIEVPFAVLFGSRAQGSHGPSSDIDVVVVSARFDEAKDRRDADLLWRVAASTDCRLEPIPCGERQWTEDHRSPILEIARRHGVLVAA